MGRKVLAVGIALAAALTVWWAFAQESGVPEPGAGAAERGDQVMIDRIRAGAQASGDALLAGDDATVVEWTYPTVVEQIGGRDAMLNVLATSRRYMSEQGLELQAYTVDTVSDIYVAGAELHAVVRTVYKLKVPAGLMTQPGFLLAVSTDEGATWRFVDGAQLNAETVLDVVPAFNPALDLPTALEPTFESTP